MKGVHNDILILLSVSKFSTNFAPVPNELPIDSPAQTYAT